MENNYKRTIAGSVGAGVGALFNASGRKFYILEHKTESKYHHVGESQKIIVDQIELGRDSSCQVRFDESMDTVSRRHAAIVRDGEVYKLIPMSQTNATLVNGQAISGEWHLNSGDEIRLSSRGPIMGFIIPQGNKSLVKSIGLTERMSLFRQQALRPYKRAIIVLIVIMILAIGGLVAWNLYQSKQANETFAMQQAEIEAQQEALDSQKAEIVAQQDILDDQKAQIEAQQQQIVEAEEANRLAQEQLANNIELSNAEREQLQKQIANTSARVSKMTKELNTQKEQYQQNIEKLENQIKETEAKQVEINAASQAIEVAAKPAQIAETPKETYFSDINNCNDAVYYIKIDNITVYDVDNREIGHFDLQHKIGGTGFMLEDGRFVTACRIIEPWYYYKGLIGRDLKGREWSFQDIQAAASLGMKVVANYTAYSPSGTNFKCSNTDFTMPKASEYKEEWLQTETYHISNKTMIQFVKKRAFTLYYRESPANVHKDWAVMAKREQLHVVKGLKYSASESLNPVGGKEVNILGFPIRSGFTNSQSVHPQKLTNNINVTDLNDVNIIELSSRRYQEGNDGSPVLQKINGEWTVIGVLSHTDSADRDVVVPISYVKK